MSAAQKAALLLVVTLAIGFVLGVLVSNYTIVPR